MVANLKGYSASYNIEGIESIKSNLKKTFEIESFKKNMLGALNLYYGQ